MKISNQRRAVAGVSLIDCLVYFALFSVLTTLAYSAYWRFELQSRRLQQNAEDVVQAIQAGERWRDDVRRATAPVRFEKNENVETLHIPQKSGEVTYIFEQRAVKRCSPHGQPVGILANVKSTDTQFNRRGAVNVWRWEFELNSREKIPKIRPLFSFQAVTPFKK